MRREHTVKRESAILGFGVAVAVAVAGFQLIPTGAATLASSTPASTSIVKSTSAAATTAPLLSAPKISVSGGQDD